MDLEFNLREEVYSKVLHKDALADAEKITGKSYKKDELTQFIGFLNHSRNVQITEETMKYYNDSYYGISMEEYLPIIDSLGFKRIYEEFFIVSHEPLGDTKDFFYCYWHEDGILLKFDTYTWTPGEKKTINGGKFYYNIKERQNKKIHEATSSGYFMASACKTWCGDHDCREAIKYNIEHLRNRGIFLNPWIETPFLQLCNYIETKGVYNSEVINNINKRKISKFPECIKKAILFDER